MEWLRVVGMLLVFVVHAAEPFNPWDSWHIVNPARSRWMGELVLAFAPWIMPLFMTLAGEGAWYALATRSSRTYLRERLLRLGLPLAAGILLLVPPQVYLERRLHGQFEGSFLAFYPHFFEGIYPLGNFAWHNLWFLVFLLVFAVVTVPLFQRLRTQDGRRLMARLAAPCQGRLGLLWMVLPAVAARLTLAVAFPGFPLIAYDWSNRSLLFPAFLFGFAVAGEPGFGRAVARHWRSALVAAVAGSIVLGGWAWPGDVLTRVPAPRSPGGVLLWSGYGMVATCWVIGVLGAARRHLTRSPASLTRLSEVAYPFYVLHHPVIVAVAFAVVQWQVGIPLAFLTLVAVSLAISTALSLLVSSVDALRVPFGLRALGSPRGVPP